MELERTDGVSGVCNLTCAQLKTLAEQIRQLIISTVESNGGHLASSLGAVDAIVALASVFDLSVDKIVFDVGHQAYAYKILCEGAERFVSLRSKDGTSGFTGDGNFSHDCFTGGHAGNSLSVSLGCLSARDKLNRDYYVIAFVGDGSFFNGENLEALFSTEKKPKKFIIVFNDNGMSISPNNNGAYKLLSELSLKKSYRATKNCLHKVFDKTFIGTFLHKLKYKFKRSLNPVAVIDRVGFKYYGVYDGHNIKTLVNILKEIKKSGNSAFLHIRTVKGKGYELAERNPERYHGVSKNLIPSENTFSQSLSPILCDLVKKYPELFAITAGMKLGTGLSDFASGNPNNFIDVGICEQHAVSMASGMALSGLKPIVCVYSTFLQRAYDQIMIDVCIKNLPVVFLLDRAGFVGSDGKTHQGLFDLSYMRTFPNMTVLAPKDTDEFALMLDYALSLGTPVALRYPNGVCDKISSTLEFSESGQWEILKSGDKVAIFAVGPRMISLSLDVANEFSDRQVAVVNCRSIKPLDGKVLNRFSNHTVITLEENSVCGGFGEAVNGYYADNGFNVKVIKTAAPDGFVAHSSVSEQLEQCGFTEKNLKNVIENALKSVRN